MTSKNQFIWKSIHVICWMIFIGLCIQTGTLIFNFIFSLFKPIAAYNLDSGLNLAEMYNRSIEVYVLFFSFLIAIAAVKAVTFYYVLRLLKELRLVNPFTESVSDLILKITYQAFSVGILCYLAHQFSKHLLHRGYAFEGASKYWNDSSAYLMMSAILFVVALIFKKGVELQHDNDLTI